MTDDTQTAPTSSDSPKANAQDPLSVLEDILNEAKERTAGGAQTTEEQAAAEAAKRAAIERQEAERKKQDALALQAEIEKMKQISEMPQEQARLRQEQQQDADAAEAKQSHQTNQIRQLGHTKI